MLTCTCEGTVTGFGLANPKLMGEREQACTMLRDQPANRPAPGTAVITGKGLSGERTGEFFARRPAQPPPPPHAALRHRGFPADRRSTPTGPP